MSQTNIVLAYNYYYLQIDCRLEQFIKYCRVHCPAHPESRGFTKSNTDNSEIYTVGSELLESGKDEFVIVTISH